MKKHLPDLYVMAISALAACMTLFWWQSQQTIASLQTQNQRFHATLENLVEREVTLLQMRYEEMNWDIVEEVENQNKITNVGMKDTLLILRTQTECLMEELEKGRVTKGVMVQHHQWLYDLLAAAVPSYEEKFSPFPDRPLLSSVEQKLMLLQWGGEVLGLLNLRLGPTHCGFGSTLNPSLAQSQDSSMTTVIWGDTLKREVRLGLNFEPYYFSRQRTHITFFTSLGHIRQGIPKVRPATLEIPTNDLLAAGENERILTFHLHAVFKNVFGGITSLQPKPFRLRIVRPATTAYSPPN
jgi:hypothetical protein